jgi:hypothetical protein
MEGNRLVRKWEIGLQIEGGTGEYQEWGGRLRSSSKVYLCNKLQSLRQKKKNILLRKWRLCIYHIEQRELIFSFI